MSNKVKVIFTLSLMLNVLLIGFGGSMAYKKHQFKQAFKHKMTENVSEEGKQVMRDTFRQARSDKKGLIMKAVKNRKAMADLLMAEEFDAQAYDELAEQMMKDQNVLSTHKIELVKSMAQNMSIEDRKAMAHKMADIVDGFKPRHRKDHKKGEMEGKERDHFERGDIDPERLKQWREHREKRMADDPLMEDLPPPPPSEDMGLPAE